MKLTIFGEIIKAAAGFIYDFRRFLRHTSTISICTERQRDYRVVKVYHAIEKALSFRVRRQGAGCDSAKRLVSLLQPTDFASAVPFHRSVGIKVLYDWCDLEGASAPAEVVELLGKRPSPPAETPGGAELLTTAYLARGRLEDPEAFFCSRRTVRDFSPRPTKREVIERAIRIAMSSPSVCSRQAWHVYHSDDRKVIDQALTFQNGNRGFGHEVPCLLLVAVDLAAFHRGMERYQHWIDGGLFAMTLVWALHSLGLASCCLNWSQGPRGDLAFRRAFHIDDAHTIVTMIAVGYPNETIQVCASPRRPFAEIHSPLIPTSDKVGNHRK